MPSLTMMLIVAAIGGLLLIGKDAPLRLLLAKAAALAASKPALPTSNVEPDMRLMPEWLTEPNDLQVMLLKLGHHAMQHGNEELKNQTFALMKAFADLNVADGKLKPKKRKA